MNLIRHVSLLTVLTLIIFLQAPSAQTIRGIVVDDATNEPLPSATVLYEDTYRGTIANLEGEFTIEIDSFPASLLIRYIGYQSERIELLTQPSDTLKVRLAPSVTELEEIVVTDQDPGLSIMERVIARKQIWREDLKTYEADAFTRQVLRNDTTIVSITESGTRSFWDSELGHREVQLYRRQTTNIGADQNFAGVRFLPNFYDDNIEVAGFEVVGITHPDALSYYDFELAETTQIDGEPVYVINVIPARRLQPLFSGTAYVHGGEYALLEVDLKPNRVVSFPPPVKEFDLSYRQQFSDFSEDIWLPIDMRISGTVLIEMVGLRFPQINFRQTSRLSGYRVNVELPDSLYQSNDQFTRVDPDSLSDFSEQMVPLTREEELAFESIDSTNTLEKAFEPEGFLTRFMSADSDSGSSSSAGRSFLPAGIKPRAGFNRVDGFRAGLGYQKAFGELALSGSLYTDYSFHADFLNYGASLRKWFQLSGSRASFYVTGGYDNRITNRYEDNLYPPIMNDIQALFGGQDYFDYYIQESYQVGIGLRRFLPNTDLAVSFKSSNDRSIQTSDEAVFNYSLFGWHDVRRPNLPVLEGSINSLRINLDINRQDANFGIVGGRQLRLSAEHAAPGLGSDVTFTKLSMFANWNLETFFKRRVFANTFDLQLTAGIVLGDAVPQRQGVVDGSLSGFTPFGTLKTRRNRPYIGSRYWSVTAEHNFRSIPFELLGLRALADRGWGVIIFGGAGYASSDSNSEMTFTLPGTDTYHTEAGVSLNSIFGIFRVDFAKRLDDAGSYFGISVPRYF